MPLHQLGLEPCFALPLEERGALERTPELLRDLREHPPFVRGQRAPLLECDADGPRGPVKRHHGIDSTPASSCSSSSGPGTPPERYPARAARRPARPHRVRGGLDADRGTGRQRHSSGGPPHDLQRPHVVRVGDPHRDQARAERLEEERDARLGDLGRQCGPREARREPLQRRRVPFQDLRALAGGALGLVRAPKPPLGADPGGGEDPEHEREHPSADQHREGRAVRHLASASRDEPAATAELQPAHGAGPRRLLRGETSVPPKLTRARTSAGRSRRTSRRRAGRTTRSRSRRSVCSPASARTPPGRPGARSPRSRRERCR